jgi:hypothetical protein
MSDATDAVAEAITQNRRLAAKHLVRKQDLEAELAKLRGQHVDDPALAAEVDARIAAATTELQAATYDYQAALAELAALDRLGYQARKLEVDTIAASLRPDPLSRAPEDIALANVREHAADLDAQVRLADELGERPAPAPKPAPPSREEADANARREFEALRARRTGSSAPSDPEADPPDPPARPKKTL